ncbi:hypothetical protein [Compostibacter hankyongensis]|uniref:Uncharacterized protein n=1 Tax=Compostibacter hankyongensis TaxID=1007089 RepID=A0ABP8FHJ5_9BACT
MEKIHVLIDKLQELKNDHADLNTLSYYTQVLYAEIMHARSGIQSHAGTRANVAVILPGKQPPAPAAAAPVVQEAAAAPPPAKPSVTPVPESVPAAATSPVSAPTSPRETAKPAPPPAPQARPEPQPEPAAATQSAVPAAQPAPPAAQTAAPAVQSHPAAERSAPPVSPARTAEPSAPPPGKTTAPTLFETPETHRTEAPAAVPARESHPQNTPIPKELHELIAREGLSLNDRLRTEQLELGRKLGDSPIDDLHAAIGINDKFLFINELFRGDRNMYERSLKTINGCSRLEDAEYWMERELKIKLGWLETNETVRHFYTLVRKRFASI